MHLKHKGEFSGGKEVGTPLPLHIVVVGIQMAPAGPSSSACVLFP